MSMEAPGGASACRRSERRPFVFIAAVPYLLALGWSPLLLPSPQPPLASEVVVA